MLYMAVSILGLTLIVSRRFLKVFWVNLMTMMILMVELGSALRKRQLQVCGYTAYFLSFQQG